jgi:hypothetical protein
MAAVVDRELMALRATVLRWFVAGLLLSVVAMALFWALGTVPLLGGPDSSSCITGR